MERLKAWMEKLSLAVTQQKTESQDISGTDRLEHVFGHRTESNLVVIFGPSVSPKADHRLLFLS